MKKDTYIYPAIFTSYKQGIEITFPDLPGCVSNAKNIDEALKCAKEVLALHLFGMEEDNIYIPDPSSINNLKLNHLAISILIEVYMPFYRETIENSYSD